MMEIKLIAKERTCLMRQHRLERNDKICGRIKAILAFDDGYSYAEIARILLLGDETIPHHIKDYFKHHKLAPEHGGNQSFLNEAQTQALVMHLQVGTYLCVKDIYTYVKCMFNQRYSVSGMMKWLHAHHFCYKKPHGVPAKADKEAQKHCIAYYQQLKRTAGADPYRYHTLRLH